MIASVGLDSTVFIWDGYSFGELRCGEFRVGVDVADVEASWDLGGQIG